MFAGFYSFRPQALGAKNIVYYDMFFSRARCYVSRQIARSSIFPSSPQGRASVCYGPWATASGSDEILLQLSIQLSPETATNDAALKMLAIHVTVHYVKVLLIKNIVGIFFESMGKHYPYTHVHSTLAAN